MNQKEYSKIRQTLAKNSVIILGSYKEVEFLEKVKFILENHHDLLGIVATEIKTLESDTPRKKLHYLISGAKFVIADDRLASGEIIELGYCRNVGVITAIVRSKEASSWMTLDFEIHSEDFKTFKVELEKRDKVDMEKIKELVKEILKWVNLREKQVKGKFKSMEKHYTKKRHH